MSKVVFIKENSPKVRKKLKEAGFTLCSCTEFKDAIWLDYYPGAEISFNIHGVGYTDEVEDLFDLSPLQRIETWLSRKGWYPDEREFFKDVDSFLDKYAPKEPLYWDEENDKIILEL